MKKKVLYIGGFQLPDKNAAALRVVSNAKILKKLNYEVIFFSVLKERQGNIKPKERYEGFECFNYRYSSQVKYSYDIKKILSIIKGIKIDIVIAYNYPAIALNHLRKYCHSHHVKCIADVTEWYPHSKRGNLLFRIMKNFDTEFRMKYVHTRMDGIIAISEYLFEYYKNKTNTIKLPPLVDLDEPKWAGNTEKKKGELNLIYAGSPSVSKERLDIIIREVENLHINIPVYLHVIGVSKDEFNQMYDCQYTGEKVIFYGRVSNDKVIKMTKEADWTIVLRENNRQVQAGFPTKVSESISCGTPVIANRFSNICDYLNEDNSILVRLPSEFSSETLKEALNHSTDVNIELFDYRNYIEVVKTLVN